MSEGSRAAEYSDRRQRVADSLASWKLDALLVTTPSDLRWLVGFGGTTSLGPNPFTGGPSAALIVARTEAVITLPDSDVGALPETELERVSYPTFLELSPLFPRRLFVHAVEAALERIGLRTGRLGIQEVSIPVAVSAELALGFPELRLENADGGVGLLRMRKSASEVEAIRRAVALCDLAQATVAEAASPGVRELDILDAVQATITSAAGAAPPLIHEVTSGPKSGTIGNTAGERRLEPGEFLLTDIAPQLDGYWGDSCATRVIGEASEEQLRMLRVASEALAKGTEAIRPGVLARNVDRIMREHVGARFSPYPNSGGHGIGLDYHEPPRLVPSETIAIEEGMVLALEPGMYLDQRGGIRLEHVVLVGADGCEVLSHHLTSAT